MFLTSCWSELIFWYCRYLVKSGCFDAKWVSWGRSLEAFHSGLNSHNGNRIMRMCLVFNTMCETWGKFRTIPVLFLIWRLTWQAKWRRWGRVSLKASTWIIHHLLLYFRHLRLCLPWCPLSILFLFIPEPWAHFHLPLKQGVGDLQVST